MKYNKYLLIFLLIAMILRLGYALYSYNGNVMENFKDDNLYMEIAERVIKQGPLILENDSEYEINKICFGLPWLMAIFLFVFGKNWMVLFVVNALINTATIWLIFLICRKLFNRNIGLVSIIIAIFYVPYIKYISTAGKEPWLVFLFALCFYLFIILINQKRSLKHTVLFALVYSLLIHVDERYLAYFPVFFLLFVFYDNYNRRDGFRKAFVYTGIVIFLMIPWTIRNFIVHDKLIILSPRTESFTDKLFGYNEQKKIVKDVKLEKDYRYLDSEQIDSVIKGTKLYFDNGMAISQDQIEAMKDGILPHEFNYFEKILSTIEELWRPIDLKREYEVHGYRYNGIWSLRHNLSVGLTYGVILLFSLFAFLGFVKQRNKWGYIFLIIIAYHTFVHVFLMGWAQARYRLPIDFILIMSAVYLIYSLFEQRLNSILSKKPVDSQISK